MASSRSPVFQLPFGYFSAENIEPAFPYPSPPAPPGLPILDDNEFSMLGDFFEKVSSANFDTSEYFSDKNLPQAGDGDYLFGGWQDEPLPPVFHGTATTLPQQPMNSHGYSGLSHHHEQMAVNGLRVASAEVMSGSSATFHNGQLHQNGHNMSEDHMFPTREIANILMEVNNTSSSGQRSMGSFSAHSTIQTERRASPNPVMRRLSPNHLVAGYYSALDAPASRSDSSVDSSDVPISRKIEVKWGSDGNFLGNGYVPPADGASQEERELEMVKTMACLIPSKSDTPNNSGPPSPTDNRKQKPREGTSFQSNGSNQDDIGDHGDPRPGKRRKCRSEDADDDEDDDSKARKGSTGNAKSNRRKSSLSDSSFKRRKSQNGGQKANRENLTEEQKRSNHIMSEQKRRNLIKQGFDDLCDLVPDLKGGGYSKSAVLLQSADWLEDLLKGNDMLRNILASLEGRAPEAKEKRGRPSKADTAPRTEEGQPTRKRRKSNQTRQVDRDEGEGEEEYQEYEEAEALDPEELPFPILKPRVQKVPKHTVSTKWDVLSSKSQEQVKELLKAVERPVLMSYRNERRREEAQSILGSIRRKLGAKIPRMPFPAQTKDGNFDFEKILESNRTLEAQLTPNLHSNSLLKAEIEKEELLLQADEEQLAELEKDARAAEKTRQRQQSKVHPLLKKTEAIKAEDDAESIRIADSGLSKAPSLDTQADEALVPLVQQLQSHLESMENNTAPVKVLRAAVASTQAILDDTLYKHMGAQQYSQIIGC